MIEAMLDFWNRRSAAFRWILFIPVSFLFAMVAYAVLYLVLTIVDWIWGREDYELWILARGVVFQALFLVTLNQTSPRRGDIVVLVFVILRAMLLLSLLALPVIVSLGYLPDLGLDRAYWTDTILEIAVLIVGIFLYRYFRRGGGDPQWAEARRIAALELSNEKQEDTLVRIHTLASRDQDAEPD